jgi:hypothetical protein
LRIARELAELDRVDERGNLAPLSGNADPRIVTVAANSLIERAWGKPRNYDPSEEEKTQRPKFDPSLYTFDELEIILRAAQLMQEKRQAPPASGDEDRSAMR